MKLFDTIQLLTGIAVLGGLIVVIFELQQSRVLARAQLASDHYLVQMDNIRVTLGENPAAALVKSCRDPEQLTSEEKYIVSKINHLSWLVGSRARQLEKIANLGIDWQFATEESLRSMLSNPIGRHRFETNKGTIWDPDIVEMAERLTNDNRIQDCLDQVPGFDEWIKNNHYQNSPDDA